MYVQRTYSDLTPILYVVNVTSDARGNDYLLIVVYMTVTVSTAVNTVLFISSQTVLWTGKGNTWKTISLGDVIEPKQVRAIGVIVIGEIRGGREGGRKEG
jgi:hypothetical protein